MSIFAILFVGKITEHKMFVMDSFALPVEGTETRVNAQSAAYEYMTAYIESAKKVNYLQLISTSILFNFTCGWHQRELILEVL